MAAYTIRAGTDADLPLLGPIERDAAQLYRQAGYDFCADGPVRDEVEKQRALNQGAVFVACTPVDEPCGFVLLWQVDGCAHILELAVLCAHQGHGLGRQLMARAEDWASARGFGEITLTTYRDIAWNAPLYERLGYVCFEPEAARTGLAEIQQEEADSGYALKPRIAMRKPLKGA